MHSSAAGRLSALCLLAAGLFLAACGDGPTTSINAPHVPERISGSLPPAPPALSPIMAAAPGAMGMELAEGSARVALASTASALHIGAQGTMCNLGPGLHIRVPRPQGTQNFVQSYETAYWYPRIWRYDGQKWTHFGDVGFVTAKLPSTTPQWTIHQTNRAVGEYLIVTVPDGYYLVESFMYFDASQQWMYLIESAFNQQAGQVVALNRQWCQLQSVSQNPGM